MIKHIKSTLDLNVLRFYAVSTTVFFSVLALANSFSVPMHELFSWNFFEKIQPWSLSLFVMVLASSLLGSWFYHWIKLRPPTRNAHVFVFATSAIKFGATLLFFHVIPG
jgi:hypothetical protein